MKKKTNRKNVWAELQKEIAQLTKNSNADAHSAIRLGQQVAELETKVGGLGKQLYGLDKWQGDMIVWNTQEKARLDALEKQLMGHAEWHDAGHVFGGNVGFSTKPDPKTLVVDKGPAPSDPWSPPQPHYLAFDGMPAGAFILLSEADTKALSRIVDAIGKQGFRITVSPCAQSPTHPV
jgi:hypothetical protein